MKKIGYIFIFILSFIFIMKANAFSINGPSSVYVGENIAVTVEAYGLTGRFDISSSNGYVVSGGELKWLENESHTFYFTASNAGWATITVNATNVSDSEGNEISGSRSFSINVIEKSAPQPIYINRTYSDNNFLSNLAIDGYELTPGFDKNTLEYKVELIPGTEKAHVVASSESDVASIRGTGDIDVTDGMNTINIVVIAENGNERTYVIKAHMDEKDPINVTIDKEKYTVIKKKELVEPKEGYDETIVKINGFDIPALYNPVTGNILVGLKDSNGNIDLFLYESKTGEYKKFIELSFNGVNLLVLDDDNSIYKKSIKKINDVETPTYELKYDSEKYLIYGTNTSTGNTGYYLYDPLENTLQRYNMDEVINLTKQRDKLILIIKLLGTLCIISIVFMIVIHKTVERKEINKN